PRARGPPVTDRAVRLRCRGPGGRGRRRAARARTDRACDPSADGCAEDLAPARDVERRAHRRARRPLARRARACLWRRVDAHVTFAVIAGTGTEVGKTYVAVQLARALRERDIPVAARNPVQSFAGGDTAPTDADLLARATGEAPLAVCPPHR